MSRPPATHPVPGAIIKRAVSKIELHAQPSFGLLEFGRDLSHFFKPDGLVFRTEGEREIKYAALEEDGDVWIRVSRHTKDDIVRFRAQAFMRGDVGSMFAPPKGV